MPMPSINTLLDEVDAWFAEEVQHVPLSQSTELYNQIHGAWQSLRNRIAVAVTGEPLVLPAPPAEELVLSQQATAETSVSGTGVEETPISSGEVFQAKSSKTSY